MTMQINQQGVITMSERLKAFDTKYGRYWLTERDENGRPRGESLTGYDGYRYYVGHRVQLHPDIQTESWAKPIMCSSRGTVRDKQGDRVYVELDNMPGRIFVGSEGMFSDVGYGVTSFMDRVEQLTWIKK